MTNKGRATQFSEGAERLNEISRRLGRLSSQPEGSKTTASGLGGVLGTLGGIMEQLGKLAQDAQANGGGSSQGGEFTQGSSHGFSGVYGFSVNTRPGDKGVKVEPFGNIKKDERSGSVEVHEVREPMTDIFDEVTHFLIVLEVPGITHDDVLLDLQDDILTLVAERAGKKYRKEMLLSAHFAKEKMSFTCRGGIVEIRLDK